MTSRLPCMYVSATNVHEHNVHEHNVHEIKICIYVRRPVPGRVRYMHDWGPVRLLLGRSRQGAATSTMQRSAHAATLLADCNYNKSQFKRGRHVGKTKSREPDTCTVIASQLKPPYPFRHSLDPAPPMVFLYRGLGLDVNRMRHLSTASNMSRLTTSTTSRAGR